MLEYDLKMFLVVLELGVGGWVVVVVVVVGGPSNFIVNQSPNPWILGFEILDLDYGLDNRKENLFP